MSKKPRNSSTTQLAAEAIVQRNLANLPDELKVFVTPSQIKKSYYRVQQRLEKEQAGFGARKTHSLQYRLRGAYPEPAWFKNCIRMFATPETTANGNPIQARMKLRSRRGWTEKTPKQIKAEADAAVLKARADHKAALKEEAALRHADYVALWRLREKHLAAIRSEPDGTEELNPEDQPAVLLDLIKTMEASMDAKTLNANLRDWTSKLESEVSDIEQGEQLLDSSDPVPAAA